MFCKNCGNPLSENDNFCIYCGTPKDQTLVQKPTTDTNFKPSSNEDKEARILCIISLVLMYAAGIPIAIVNYLIPILRPLTATTAALSPLAAIVLMIVARIKYPKNKFAKIVMWIYIVTIALSLLALALFMIWCYVTCSNMDTSGCS